VDLRKDERTAGAYSFGNGVFPNSDVARRILSEVRSGERARLITGGRLFGARTGALVVTGQRVLLVPPPGHGPVEEMAKPNVSGVVAVRAGIARVALRADTEPAVWRLDAFPAARVDDLRRVLPRVEKVAGFTGVRRWARQPGTGASPTSAWTGSWRTATDAVREAWTTAVNEAAPTGTDRASSLGARSAGAAAPPPPPASSPTAPRMRASASPSAPVSLSGGPPAHSWTAAERLAAVAMVHLGFPDALVTAPGKDDGVDVVARGAVAQVKFWQSAVGAPAVRDLFGTATAAGAKGLFFSLTGYTAEAGVFAERAGVHLFTFTTDGTVVARSTAARTLMIDAIARLADPVEQRRLQAERSAFETTAQEVERLTARVRWLTDAARRTRRTVRGRGDVKKHERAVAGIESAVAALTALDAEPLQIRRAELVREASAALRRAAKDLGVKAP
jgi:hypothetical protein